MDTLPHRRDWIAQILQSGAALALTPAFGDAQQNWKPQVLSTDQNATLVALGERIVPGSAAASCNQVIDFILTVESDKNKQDLQKALAALDAEAKTRHQQSFSSLPSDQQDDLLTALSAANHPLQPHFVLVKEWIADTYWSSQPGLKELGWNGQMAWTSSTACQVDGSS